MGKTELVQKIAEQAGITKAAATKAVAAFTGSVVKATQSGDRVTLVGFGTFTVVKREARKGKNPQTGADIKIPAKRVLKFKPSSSLKMK
ncbi:MAG: HU family DNA-binding protein [Pseudomonadota bacterium]